MPLTADDICRAAWPAAQWERVDEEADLLARMFEQPAQSLVRLGDGELGLLRRGATDPIARELLRAIHAAGVLGLPERFDGRMHPWRTALRAEIAALADGRCPPSPVISAVLPLYRPSIIARIARGRRVLWVTHKAGVIVHRLKFAAFCECYGFDEGRADAALDTVPGRTLPNDTPDPLAKAREICAAIEAQEFDLAIVGMGALGKLLVRHVAQEMRRPALDAGCILSAYRGDWGDRLVFQRELKDLVWKTRL
ncbi:MAG TPA: hypothetical protein VGO11_05490 [Chthoniobacteraceae bacterium]|jgi:hypothetical protein|nr:hypothetical protein [Chthoniobacteraceae bacterium]